MRSKLKQLHKITEERDYYKGALDVARNHVELLRAQTNQIHEEIDKEKEIMKGSVEASKAKALKLGVGDRLKNAFSKSAKSLGAVNKQLSMQNEQYLEAIEQLSAQNANGTPRPDYESPNPNPNPNSNPNPNPKARLRDS